MRIMSIWLQKDGNNWMVQGCKAKDYVNPEPTDWLVGFAALMDDTDECIHAMAGSIEEIDFIIAFFNGKPDKNVLLKLYGLA